MELNAPIHIVGTEPVVKTEMEKKDQGESMVGYKGIL